ncbi:hypothetical protein EJD04_25545 [Salmonella enterica]|nr:hypothetical protein [Salmonella enterica]
MKKLLTVAILASTTTFCGYALADMSSGSAMNLNLKLTESHPAPVTSYTGLSGLHPSDIKGVGFVLGHGSITPATQGSHGNLVLTSDSATDGGDVVLTIPGKPTIKVIAALVGSNGTLKVAHGSPSGTKAISYDQTSRLDLQLRGTNGDPLVAGDYSTTVMAYDYIP